MSRLVHSLWKFRWWENKAPYDLINGQPFGGHNGRTCSRWSSASFVARRINSRSTIDHHHPSHLGKPVPSRDDRRAAKSRGIGKGGRERRKEESDRTPLLSLSLFLSLAPRLFINALIRGELLERWYPKREADTHPRVSMRPTH